MRYSLATFALIAALLWAGSALAAPEVYSPAPSYPGRYTNQEEANLAAVKALFNDFTTGDMDAFYAMMSNDIVWEVNGSSEFVPEHGITKGIDALRVWMDKATSDLEFLDFGADQYFADGDTVIAICHERDHVPSTDKMIDENEVMFFTFADGKVTHVRIFDDSAQEQWALTPDTAGASS